ncbi:unnamed protein product [Caenorhabditis bovis]|uniref:C-type lectin domain-containing protein n=1 Tax=Caenorhabditis bovis TaxID=2654633 RepID=A0A8S1EUN6_9PELO|nr:unnamed protein product [Caenorhabditis bovis]
MKLIAILLIIIHVCCDSGIPVIPCINCDCPLGFRRFNRPDGHAVCIKMAVKWLNYYQAVSLCASQAPGAKLIGLATKEEIDYVAARSITANAGYWWYYIGAFRNPFCHAEREVLETRPNCSIDKMFVWTDNITESKFAWSYKWHLFNPNSFYKDGEFESAIAIKETGLGDWR